MAKRKPTFKVKLSASSLWRILALLSIALMLSATAALYSAWQVLITSTVTQTGVFQVKKGARLVGLCEEISTQPQLCPMLMVASKLGAVQLSPKVGFYKVAEQATLLATLQQFADGKEHQFSITLVEGITWLQFKQQLQAEQYLTQDLDDAALLLELQSQWPTAVSLEGLLLPDTYFFTGGSSAQQLTKRAALALHREAQAIWQTNQVHQQISDPYHLLILASIIEKETGKAQERELIAAVFYNRLQKRMRLQTDPTVIYGMGADFAGNISKNDLKTWTPYNTYRIDGLPPTPIAMASRASIQAAAQPASVPYLYFVAKGNGEHQFSTTLDEHNRAVKLYQLRK